MQFVRLVVFGFVALSVIYVCLSLYSRSVRRERLENEYDAAPVDGVSRDDYVENGMIEYSAGLRPKLLLGVYVVPAVAAAIVIYLTNAN